MVKEMFEAAIALELEEDQEAFLNMAYAAIELRNQNTSISPFFHVLHIESIPCIPPRPFLYEDEKCVVLSSNSPSKYYFKVIPRKPVTMLPKPIIEESDILLKEHLMCVAKNLANKYGIADVEIDGSQTFVGSRFCLHFHIHVTSKKLPIDPASFIFEKHESSTPATNLEALEEIQELKKAFEEYFIMDSKFRLFFAPAGNGYFEQLEDWRTPEDAEMRAISRMRVLQNMFPYTFVEDQPFSYFVENLPHYIPEVQQLEENAYQTANSPIDYVITLKNLIEDVRSMYTEKYPLPGYMIRADEFLFI